jgi:hypothetical protein
LSPSLTTFLKRVISIVLLILFLFNVGGYYILFWGLRHQSDLELKARLDAELYSEDHLLELKIPVALPYPIEQQDFKRVDGRLEHQGEIYKMVKHKLENDTVYILCIRDLEEKKLVKNMTEFGKMANDLPASSKNPLNTLFKMMKDFQQADIENIFTSADQRSPIYFSGNTIAFLSLIQSIPSPPPEA